MKQVYKKYNKLFIILVLTILSFLYIKRDEGPGYEFSAPVNVEINSEEERSIQDIEDLVEETYFDGDSKEEPLEKVPIYVCGEVKNPDVYYLYETSIVNCPWRKCRYMYAGKLKTLMFIICTKQALLKKLL